MVHASPLWKWLRLARVPSEFVSADSATGNVSRSREELCWVANSNKLKASPRGARLCRAALISLLCLQSGSSQSSLHLQRLLSWDLCSAPLALVAKIMTVSRQVLQPKIHLLDQKYSKNCEILLHFKIFFYVNIQYFKIYFFPLMLIWIFSIITPVFSVTWFFRNHSNMLICCSRNLLSVWNTVVLLNIFAETGFFEYTKEQHLFEIEIYN